MKLFAEITTVANKYTNSFFLNVVEEPAQNLFPAKSYELMNKGVKCDFSTQKQNERQ